MKFDWDENKEVDNIKIHDDIIFDEASAVFSDIWAIESFDESHSNFEEQRFTIVGLTRNRLLRVTFTVRINEDSEEIIRIISARKAVGYEKREYEQNRNKFKDVGG